MDFLTLEKEMRRLWKQTFHDSDAYIDLVFSTYFNPDLVEYEEQDGKLLAALMGVEYEFRDKGSLLHGLYLCGLSTIEEHRGEGIMSDLLKRINIKADEKGFDFTFLIPADRGLIRYYRDRGYVEGFYRVINNYTNVHDFTREYRSKLMRKDERISSLKMNYYNSLECYQFNIDDAEDLEAIIEFITKCEADDRGMSLCHSPEDINAILMENTISHGDVIVTRTRKGDIRAIGVASIVDDKEVKVSRVFCQDQCSFFKTLDHIKKKYEEFGMVVYQSTESDRSVALWYDNYIPDGKSNDSSDVLLSHEAVYKRAGNVAGYGMIRILKIDEILKFITKERRDCDFSILVKNEEKGEISSYSGKNGKFRGESMSETHFICKYGDQKLGEAMSIKGLSSILCRKPDTDNWINAAFGLPRLALDMCLMLD